MNLKELEQEFKTNLNGGLNDEQVLLNRKQYGTNELESKKKQSIIVKFLLQFKDALIIILLISAIISIIIDPSEWVDSLIIFVVVIVNAILGVYQENKAEKSLDALRSMSSPNTKVFRNNSLISIPSNEVVVGDIMYVEAGDSISADGRIIECSNLKVDEAVLTGESVPVDKDNNELSDYKQIGDATSMLFSSTCVTNGKAKALVTNVGMNTEVGKIAGMLNDTTNQKTPLQDPNVSTAGNFFTIAFCLLILLTPIDNTIVTTVARPSGIAATAKAIAVLKHSIHSTLKSLPCLYTATISRINTIMQTTNAKIPISFPT